jgi:hypothetical protein
VISSHFESACRASTRRAPMILNRVSDHMLASWIAAGNLVTTADLDAMFGEDYFDGMPSATAVARANGCPVIAHS